MSFQYMNENAIISFQKTTSETQLRFNQRTLILSTDNSMVIFQIRKYKNMILTNGQKQFNMINLALW